jgi:hypothetical protein
MMTEEEYQDYRDRLTEVLYKLQEDYKKKPTRLKVFLSYQLLRELKAPLPEWVLTGLDRYLSTITNEDRGKRKHRTDQMKFLDYITIISSSDPVQAKEDYAKLGKCTSTDKQKTLDNVRQRMKKWKKTK